jgi:hypothetical protein
MKVTYAELVDYLSEECNALCLDDAEDVETMANLLLDRFVITYPLPGDDDEYECSEEEIDDENATEEDPDW